MATTTKTQSPAMKTTKKNSLLHHGVEAIAGSRPSSLISVLLHPVVVQISSVTVCAMMATYSAAQKRLVTLGQRDSRSLQGCFPEKEFL